MLLVALRIRHDALVPGSTAEDAAGELRAVIPSVKRGSLRMFGVWFGKAFDNVHVPCSARSEGLDLVVVFDEGEELRLTEPEDWEFSEHVFRVQTAVRVRWRWYSYGSPKTPANLRTVEYLLDGDRQVRVLSHAGYDPADIAATNPAAELL